MARIVVKVHGLAHGGAFVGEVLDENSPLQGKKAFIREVCPGETVEAEIISDKPSFVEARLTQILTPASHRVPPPCPHFEVCGGCDLQHLMLAAQREAKRQMVEDMLRRQGGIVAPGGVVLVGAELPGTAYRRRVALHLNEAGEVGFYRPNSGDVVPIKECLVATPLINDCLRSLAPRCANLACFIGGVVIEEHRGEAFVLLKLHDGVSWGSARTVIFEDLCGAVPNINVLEGKKERVLTRHFAEVAEDFLPVGHFSQVNEDGNEALLQIVRDAVSGSKLVELYAGAGNLSIPLAKRGVTVTAVEVDRALVKYGKLRAAQEQVSSKIQFIQSSAEKYVRAHRLEETVLLDPPRAGAKEVVRAFSPREVKKIVYVSCSLPNLVRDLKSLVSAGFRLTSVCVLDMFPQTHHVETIAVLTALPSPK
jgi:23S rRNA (uracil1939-C5)-methyltransferase